MGEQYKNNPLFSICIPVYNTEKYLRQCLDSVFMQDFVDFEVVMVDDGSKDDSLKICEEYQSKDARFFVLHQENAGAIAARKTALKLAKGEYVIVLDSDDYLAEGLLQRLSKIILQHKPEIIKLNYARFLNDKVTEYRNKFQNRVFYGDEIQVVHCSLIYDKELTGIHTGVSYSICTTVAKRDLLIAHQIEVPQEIRLGEDLAVTAPMVYGAKSIYFTDTIDYYYRDTPGSIMNSFKVDELKRIEILLHYLAEKIPGRYHYSLNVYAVNMIWWYMAGAARNYNKTQFCKIIKAEINAFYNQCIKKCKIYKPSINESIKLFLLKRKFYGIYYQALKRLEKKGA